MFKWVPSGPSPTADLNTIVIHNQSISVTILVIECCGAAA